MKLQLAKGVRDFPPEVKIVRQNVVDALTKAFELFGYVPLETPIIERLDTLASKYAGGSEIMKEVFKLKDQGGRELGLRYDLTVPMCRFVGMNPNLKMPFKRYQIGTVYRDGPIKLGRYREFWQCDVDVVGVKKMTADAEILNIAKVVFERLNLDVVTKVNNRKLLNGMLDYVGIEKSKRDAVILSIDKLEKFGSHVVKEELSEKGITYEKIQKILDVLNEDLPGLKKLITSDEGRQGIAEIEELLNLVDVDFDVSLARGLSYYTGTVFEVFLKESPIKSSIAAGGRYDKMISEFLGSKQEYPAVGISFGLELITDVLKDRAKKTNTKVFIIPIGTFKESLKIADKLRRAGINTDMDLLERGISKNMNYANTMGIPFVIFIGEDELKAKKVKLKDMDSGKEQLLSVEDAVERLK
jgi:histidyl-tRNA synthetase